MTAQDQSRAGAIHLADIIARSLLLGSGGDRRMPRLDVAAYRLLGLDDQKLQDIMQDVDRGLATHEFVLA